MKVSRVIKRTKHWPKQNIYSCQIVAFPEDDPSEEIQAGQQLAYGRGNTAEEAEADAVNIIRDTLALLEKL